MTPAGQSNCLPNENALFSSNFESDTAGWDFSDQQTWSVVQADDSRVLRGTGHVHAFAGANWDEVVWRMRVKLSTGQAHLNFHASNSHLRLMAPSKPPPGGQMRSGISMHPRMTLCLTSQNCGALN